MLIGDMSGTDIWRYGPKYCKEVRHWDGKDPGDCEDTPSGARFNSRAFLVTKTGEIYVSNITATPKETRDLNTARDACKRHETPDLALCAAWDNVIVRASDPREWYGKEPYAVELRGLDDKPLGKPLKVIDTGNKSPDQAYFGSLMPALKP